MPVRIRARPTTVPNSRMRSISDPPLAGHVRAPGLGCLATNGTLHQALIALLPELARNGLELRSIFALQRRSLREERGDIVCEGEVRRNRCGDGRELVLSFGDVENQTATRSAGRALGRSCACVPPHVTLLRTHGKLVSEADGVFRRHGCCRGMSCGMCVAADIDTEGCWRRSGSRDAVSGCCTRSLARVGVSVSAVVRPGRQGPTR